MQQINRIQGNIPDIGFEIFMYICEHEKTMYDVRCLMFDVQCVTFREHQTFQKIGEHLI